jgi:hypothetical protein
MIAKAFFLAKIIHRIGTRILRHKKCLPESAARAWSAPSVFAAMAYDEPETRDELLEIAAFLS